MAGTYVIAGFERPSVSFNNVELQNVLSAFNRALQAACQAAKTNIQNDQNRLNADAATAQAACQQATALWSTANGDFTAGIEATSESQALTDFQNCLNAITQQTPSIQATYAKAFADAISAVSDMKTILANPPMGCDLSPYNVTLTLCENTLTNINNSGSIFNGLAGLAGLASAKITSLTPPTAAQVAQCMTINVTWYGFDEVLNEPCTQQMITWYKANIGTGWQDLVNQITSALGKIPTIGGIVSSILNTFTSNIFNVMTAIEKLDKGNGVTIHNSGLAFANPLYNLMTTANLQSEASGTQGGDWYDAIWVTAN
jgi:hypothetical protein